MMMDVLIDVLECVCLYFVDVMSVIVVLCEFVFFFVDVARGYARDVFRVFACSAT